MICCAGWPGNGKAQRAARLPACCRPAQPAAAAASVAVVAAAAAAGVAPSQCVHGELQCSLELHRLPLRPLPAAWARRPGRQPSAFCPVPGCWSCLPQPCCYWCLIQPYAAQLGQTARGFWQVSAVPGEAVLCAPYRSGLRVAPQCSLCKVPGKVGGSGMVPSPQPSVKEGGPLALKCPLPGGLCTSHLHLHTSQPSKATHSQPAPPLLAPCRRSTNHSPRSHEDRPCACLCLPPARQRRAGSRSAQREQQHMCRRAACMPALTWCVRACPPSGLQSCCRPPASFLPAEVPATPPGPPPVVPVAPRQR